MTKVSGPLRDRIDISIDVGPVEYDAIKKRESGKTPGSAEMRGDVNRVYELQQLRYKNEEIKFNAKLSPAMIDKYCVFDAESGRLLEAAYKKYAFSARADAKVKKLARTIADIEGSDSIRVEHVAEAIGYRAPGAYI